MFKQSDWLSKTLVMVSQQDQQSWLHPISATMLEGAELFSPSH